MPLYLFRHPDTEEVIEVLQKMTDEHSHVDENGVKWERVWTSPNANVDGNINPYSATDFVNKTNNMKGSLGDVWDLSKEMSEKRKTKDGRDDIFEKHDDKREGHLEKRRKKNALADLKAARKRAKSDKRPGKTGGSENT